MRSFIVTGGVGAGKSSVLAHSRTLFGASGCVYSADEEVTRMFEEKRFQQALAGVFGSSALEKGPEGHGAVNRRWLRKHVMPVTESRLKLEKLVHGHVLGALENEREQAQKAGVKVFVAEVPLHYEIGAVISADLIIVVAASRSVQVRRMMENRGLDEASTQAFLDAQWPIEAKVEKADVVIWNDGDPSALESQTLILANLLNLV